MRGSHDTINDSCQVFRLTGLLDAFSEPVFVKVLSKYIEEGPSHVILDLSGIDFLDSSGVGALVQVAKQLQNNSGSLQIVTNARVTQTLKLVRLEKFLTLQTSLDAALAPFRPDPSDSEASEESKGSESSTTDQSAQEDPSATAKPNPTE